MARKDQDMYYHFRIDKIQHDGRVDEATQVEWDFRSLHQGLIFLRRDFGADALGWRIEDLTDRSAELLMQARPLAEALESSHQYLIMTLRNDSAFAERYDHFRFFVSERDESEYAPSFTYSEGDELAISATETIFEPDVKQSILDILRSFDILGDFDFVAKAFELISEYYDDDVPSDVIDLRDKNELGSEDYSLLGDECLNCGEEQLAARLFAAGFIADGPGDKKGESLVKLADLYMNSEWPRNGGREWDVMKAVDLLSETLKCGCVQAARDTLEGMREDLFDEWIEEQPDVEYFIRNYMVDALCLAAFCLAVGIGWEKDVDSATKLLEAALSRGYMRASYYLDEIRMGRV